MKKHNDHKQPLFLIRCSLNLICVPMKFFLRLCDCKKPNSRMIPNVAAHVLICYVTFGLLVMLMEQFHILHFDVFAFNDYVDITFCNFLVTLFVQCSAVTSRPRLEIRLRRGKKVQGKSHSCCLQLCIDQCN